jgi:hypothetical protein
MKITKKNGKLLVTATAEELKKNPKLAAAIKKAQALPPTPPASPDPLADLGGGGDLGGGDLGGDVSPDLGGVDAPADGSVDSDLAGDPTEKFLSAVDKAFSDAFGKPLDEGAKQVIKGLAQMSQGEKSPAVDDLDATDGSIPGDDLGGDAGGDPAANGPGAGGAGATGTGMELPTDDVLAVARGRLTRVSSANSFVQKLAAKLTK